MDVIHQARTEIAIRDALLREPECVFGLKGKTPKLFRLLCGVIRKAYPTKYEEINDMNLAICRRNISHSRITIKRLKPIEIPLFNVLKHIAINQKNQTLSHTSQQYRAFIRDQIDDFRRLHKGTCTICNLSGHSVDHITQFSVIKDNYIRLYGKPKWTNETIRRWQEYHLEHADLRIVCRWCHDAL